MDFCIKGEDEIDVFFEGELIFLHVAGRPEIKVADEDSCIEVGMTADLLADLEDGDHIDKTPAGAVVRQLLAS